MTDAADNTVTTCPDLRICSVLLDAPIARHKRNLRSSEYSLDYRRRPAFPLASRLKEVDLGCCDGLRSGNYIESQKILDLNLTGGVNV